MTPTPDDELVVEKKASEEPIKTVEKEVFLKYNEADDCYFVEARSPINIALVKYWGKAHDTLIIPTNDSFSITLSKDTLCSTTTIRLLPSCTRSIELVLNGEVEAKIGQRILDLVATVRSMA